jgi:hypothetical protein
MTGVTELIEQANRGVVSPQTLTAQTLTPEQVALRRKICDWLMLWRHCTDKACRRGRGCAGDPTPCFAQFWTSCPEAARVWALGGMPVLEQGGSARAATRVADISTLALVRVMARLPLPRRSRKPPVMDGSW